MAKAPKTLDVISASDPKAFSDFVHEAFKRQDGQGTTPRILSHVICPAGQSTYGTNVFQSCIIVWEEADDD